MEKPKYIEFIEQSEKIFFSQYSVGIIEIEPEKLKKMELSYIESEFPTNHFARMVYAANKKEKIYLSLKQLAERSKYHTTCYFLPEKISVVEIFLKSLLNKKN